jgi:hypothetical protein
MDMEPFDGPSALGPDTVDSINNLDTARMSLRWALERLSTLGRENEQLRQKMDAESKARAQLEKDYQALQKISELQPPEPSKRKSFQDKLHGFVLMALAGKLDVAPILQREMKAQELEATARDSLAELEKKQAEFDLLRQKDEQRLEEIELLTQKLEADAMDAANKIVAERVGKLQSGWLEERQQLMTQISDMSHQLMMESNRKVTELESKYLHKLRALQKQEKIVQLRELKMKGLLDTMAADLRLTMADLTNLKANSNQERLEQLQALRVEQAKTREIKASYEKANSISRAQNSQISALRAEVTATKKHLQDIQGHAQRHGEEKEDLLVRLRDLESSLEALTKQNSRMNESILDHAEELEAERLRLSQALEQERARATQLGDHVEKLQNHLAKTESAVKATSEDLALEIERRKKMEEFISKRLEPPPPPPLP